MIKAVCMWKIYYGQPNPKQCWISTYVTCCIQHGVVTDCGSAWRKGNWFHLPWIIWQQPQWSYLDLWNRNGWHRSKHPGTVPGCMGVKLGSGLNARSWTPLSILPNGILAVTSLLQNAPVPPSPALLTPLHQPELASMNPQAHIHLCTSFPNSQGEIIMPYGMLVTLLGWRKSLVLAQRVLRIPTLFMSISLMQSTVTVLLNKWNQTYPITNWAHIISNTGSSIGLEAWGNTIGPRGVLIAKLTLTIFCVTSVAKQIFGNEQVSWQFLPLFPIHELLRTNCNIFNLIRLFDFLGRAIFDLQIHLIMTMRVNMRILLSWFPYMKNWMSSVANQPLCDF